MQRKRNLRAPGRAVLTKVTLACVAIASFSIWRGPKFFWGIPLRSNLSHVAESVPNLGFDHIYVITLPGKVDRRHAMDKLALALGLQFTYVTAVASTDPAIGWISERVHEVRTRKHEILARSGLVAAKSLGGQDIDSVWLMPSQDISPSSRVRLTPDPYHPSLRGLVFPSLAEPRWGGNDWVSYFDTEYGTGATLEPEDAHINVTDLLWDPLETYPNRQATAGTIACWLSHVQALKMMRENGDHSALILEDDVDLEFDIDRLWSSISRWLPEGGPTTLPWHTVFLGHCWGRETIGKHYIHPSLYRSISPRCTHAYAVSSAGRQQLLRTMSDPWLAYQTAVDTAYAALIMKGALNSFSVEPVLAIQRKTGLSDIRPGAGTKWRGRLADSTMERILQEDFVEIPVETFEEILDDPWAQNWHLGGPLPSQPLWKSEKEE